MEFRDACSIMPPCGKFTRPDTSLSEDATTLLFKLTEKLSEREFLDKIDELCGFSGAVRPYDFVHLPWQKLAVVNFTDPADCKRCFEVIRGLEDSEDSRACICDVREAAQQGLAANLAFVLAKSSQMSHYATIPLVRVDGELVPLDSAGPLLAPWLSKQDGAMIR